MGALTIYVSAKVLDAHYPWDIFIKTPNITLPCNILDPHSNCGEEICNAAKNIYIEAQIRGESCDSDIHLAPATILSYEVIGIMLAILHFGVFVWYLIMRARAEHLFTKITTKLANVVGRGNRPEVSIKEDPPLLDPATKAEANVMFASQNCQNIALGMDIMITIVEIIFIILIKATEVAYIRLDSLHDALIFESVVICAGMLLTAMLEFYTIYMFLYGKHNYKEIQGKDKEKSEPNILLK